MSETTTTEPADQVPLVSIGVAGSEVSDLSAAAAKALLPSGAAPLYVFSAEWHGPWNGHTLSFRAGYSYQLDPALLAYLNAQAAPITAV